MLTARGGCRLVTKIQGVPENLRGRLSEPLAYGSISLTGLKSEIQEFSSVFNHPRKYFLAFHGSGTSAGLSLKSNGRLGVANIVFGTPYSFSRTVVGLGSK